MARIILGCLSCNNRISVYFNVNFVQKVFCVMRYIRSLNYVLPFCFLQGSYTNLFIRGRNSFPSPRNVHFSLCACISPSRLKNPTILCYSFEPWLHLLARQHFCMDLRKLVNKPVISSSLTQLLGRFFSLKHMGTLRDHAIQIKAPCGVSHSSFGISF